jgi:hypothetical protein
VENATLLLAVQPLLQQQLVHPSAQVASWLSVYWHFVLLFHFRCMPLADDTPHFG